MKPSSSQNSIKNLISTYFNYKSIIFLLVCLLIILYILNIRTEESIEVELEPTKTMHKWNIGVWEGREAELGGMQDVMCNNKTCFMVVDERIQPPPNLPQADPIYMRKLLSNEINDGALSATELIPIPGEDFTKENSKFWKVKKSGPVMPVSKVLIMAQFITGTIQSEFQPLNILMIGLGGSTVNNFFSQFGTRPNITVIELDETMEKISKKWFGLEETPSHQVHIADGAKYLINRPDSAEKYDVIIIDACYNDPTNELICPVEVFRGDDIASHVKRNLKETGTLSMNSVSFSNHTNGFQNLLSTYRRHFGTCFFVSTYGNHILTCSDRLLPVINEYELSRRFLGNVPTRFHRALMEQVQVMYNF